MMPNFGNSGSDKRKMIRVGKQEKRNDVQKEILELNGSNTDNYRLIIMLFHV